jgi:hypothetical protein
VVAAEDAAEPMEISMIKAKSKQDSPSRKSSKTADKQNSASEPSGGKAAILHTGTRSKISQRPLTEQTGLSGSKQARVIAMLRASNGATIDAIMRATGWKQHSVRGFLAGVIRKKLGLNLISTVADGGRVYRIADRTTARAVSVKTRRAA